MLVEVLVEVEDLQPWQPGELGPLAVARAASMLPTHAPAAVDVHDAFDDAPVEDAPAADDEESGPRQLSKREIRKALAARRTVW